MAVKIFPHLDLTQSRSLEFIDISKEQKVGIGDPLSLEIITFYTGEIEKKFFKSKRDLLIVSGWKDLSRSNMATKMINQVVKNASSRKHYFPSAFREGSTLIYYTPGMEYSYLNVSVQMVLDNFDTSFIDQLVKMGTTAANMPIFLTNSAYIYSGVQLLKLAKALGNKFLEDKEYMKDDLNLHIGNHDFPDFHQGIYLIYNEEDFENLSGYTPKLFSKWNRSKIMLANTKDGRIYNGRAPYILISARCNSKNINVKDLNQNIATSQILQKFYQESTSTKTIEEVNKMVSVYNDHLYRKKIELTKESMVSLNTNSTEFEQKCKLIKAYEKNLLF